MILGGPEVFFLFNVHANDCQQVISNWILFFFKFVLTSLQVMEKH